MRAIDVSIYSGEIPVEKWREVKAQGYDLAVVGLFHGRTANHYAAQQMGAAHEAGMELAAYVLLAPWTGMSGEEQVSTGFDSVAVDLMPKLHFLAIDAEIDGITEEMIRSAVDFEIANGGHPIIYTGRWWWVDHFNDSQAFKDIPLWAAQYQPLPEMSINLLDEVRLYGGWTREKLVGWQYTNTTQFHGINCCKDWFDDAFIRGEEEPMPKPFTEEQEERIKEIVNWCGPGMEMQARMAVAAAFEAGAAFVNLGRWDAARNTLPTIKEAMKQWHRWEE